MSKRKTDCRIISDCYECSHCFKPRYVLDNKETKYCKCDFNYKDINMVVGIPSWCPLEDAK